MRLRNNLRFVGTGWLAGVGITLCMVLFVAPSLIGARPIQTLADLIVLGLIILLISPAALLGGFLGARLPREGGRGTQFLTAAIVGGLFAMPASCAVLWFIGW